LALQLGQNVCGLSLRCGLSLCFCTRPLLSLSFSGFRLPGSSSGFLDQLEQPLDLALPILKPVRRPHTVDGPSTGLEHLLPEPVAVAGSLRGMVRDAIALDPAEEATGNNIVKHSEINAVACDAHLRQDLHVSPRELMKNITLERRLRLGCKAGRDALQPTTLGIQEEFAEQPGAVGRCHGRVDFVPPHGGEHLHALAGTGDKHVKAPPAILAIQRPKVVAQLPVRPLRVGYADEDDVALVTLDILKVLDEERLRASTVEEQLDAGVLPSPQFKLVLDGELLAEVEGPHA